MEIIVFVREFVNRQDLNPTSVPNSPKVVVVFFFKPISDIQFLLVKRHRRLNEQAAFTVVLTKFQT